jgi:hypothetical protein
MVEAAAKNTAKNSFENRVFDSASGCKLGSIPRRSIFAFGKNRGERGVGRK